MAKAANVFRKATVDLLMIQIEAIERTVGLVIKSYRDYEATGTPKKSKTQEVVAAAAKTHEPVVSQLENGKSVPVDKILQAILKEVGLNTSLAEPKALFELLRCIRDQKADLKLLKSHKPT